MPFSRVNEASDFAAQPAVGPAAMPSVRIQVDLDDFRTAWLLEDDSQRVSLLMDDVGGLSVGQEVAIAHGGPARWAVVSSVRMLDDRGRVTLDWKPSGR